MFTLEDVMQRIYDSNDFTAGGGAASAVAAAMGGSLVGMVSRLSVGRDCGYPDEFYLKIADGMDITSLALRQGAVKDLEAFLRIKEALSLPKDTDEEKKRRRIALEKAAFKAADIPRQNAELALKIQKAGQLLKDKSNSSASSDLEVGLALANSSIQGFLANIRANLPFIKDPEVIDGLTSFIQNIESLR